ncbi:MAG: hypothetical protein A2271_01915 [Candidatus Moranbacteria bacterium RIFOXYA12_FULL_35_19]|nr:MAG: hypothetical protein UR78_C0017G0019 [Candidatus Moranbacteria bacterium GW2011_GWF2_35_39]OGI32441.1 MAG: hypothetical protein A2489_02375 [Candidatus Moranbacteria bacterium RIFOXYC12_FULL_36_13]OGI35525.1 MAG: hypothetical protein A2271_01915 [Candidatus Moranbacteria bacterium RIFOXYA12_FULL_35_19]
MKKITILASIILAVVVLVSSANAEVFACKGDVVVYGYSAVDQNDEKYESQMYLAFMETIAQRGRLYAPFWEDGGNSPLRSWDNTPGPLENNKNYFWGHIEIALEDEFANADGWDAVVVLSPTISFRMIMSLDQVVEKYESFCETAGPYNQPFYPVFTDWLKKQASDSNHWLNDPEIQEVWSAEYGIDLISPMYQYRYEHTDIDDEEFWKRPSDCSSTLAWSIIWGWRLRSSQVREMFLNSPELIASIDAIAPGQLAWWIVNRGLFSIEEIYIAPQD